jgi:exonuclease III
MTKHDLKLISYNVRGLNNARKRTAIFEHLRNQMCDIALLQETYSSDEIEKQWTQEWGGEGYFLHGSKHSKGLAILVRKNIDVELLTIEKDKGNRILFLKIKIDEHIMNVFNVYAPNKEAEQISFMNSLLAVISKYDINSADNCIFGGDWNQVLKIDLDKCGGIGNVTRQKYLDKLLEFMGMLDIIDIWRLRNGIKKRYTWRQKNPHVRCRLDYFLVSQHLQETVVRADILPSILSDHSPIAISLTCLDSPHMGPGHWKLNVFLLTEIEFKNYMRSRLKEMQQTYSNLEDLNLHWELMKYGQEIRYRI